MSDAVRAACDATPVDPDGFNPNAEIPYELTTDEIRLAMDDFIAFLTMVNRNLYDNAADRLELIMMPAGFSSLVGEFVKSAISNHSDTITENRYHNAHPDMIPVGLYPDDSLQYADEGIEIKASRYDSGWQGHNPENVWLMVFVFSANGQNDDEEVEPCSFRFDKVVGAQLDREDWSFSGRSGESRRTITASVLASGRDKMHANWIYRHPGLEDRYLPPVE